MEKRKSFSCEVCGNETEPTRHVEVIAYYDKVYHISEWRVCPNREGEKGCGHWQLFYYDINEKSLQDKMPEKKTEDSEK
ncbi:MAG: hypothetical protein ACETWK_05860 [Candidatus Aminicenantaceae bacterium]